VKWEDACASRVAASRTALKNLIEGNLIRTRPVQKEGHLASGPLVVTAASFVGWLRGRDRSCLGLEMEAAGLMTATHMDFGRRDALVIRGVSDFGDGRKSAIDQVGAGLVRRIAMENATEFLWALMEAGTLHRADRDAAPSEVSRSVGSVEEAVLKALHDRADINGRVSGAWSDLRTWVGIAEADVHAAAIHLKADGYIRTAYFDSESFQVVLRR
jgi:hypothetical protein